MARADASRRTFGAQTATGLEVSTRGDRPSTTRARSCFGFAWDDSFGLDPSLRSARARTPGLAAARTMSELLRRWLRDDVGVTQHVDSFESAFASGFLFGEILARCNVQPDFAKFVNKNTPDARINNFTRLQVRRFSGDFLEATRSTPPDSLAVRGRADTPRASTDGTRARPDLGPREASFGSVNSFRRTRSPRFVSPPRRSPLLRLSARSPSRAKASISTHQLHAFCTFCRLTPDTALPSHHSAVPAKAGHPPGRARGDLRGARGARRGESPARAVEERARRDGARRRLGRSLDSSRSASMTTPPRLPTTRPRPSSTPPPPVRASAGTAIAAEGARSGSAAETAATTATTATARRRS